MKNISFSIVLICLITYQYVYTQTTTTGTSIIIIVNATKSYNSLPPTWLTSPFFKAGNRAVINNNLTGSSSNPQYTFTFSSSFTNIPNLAYGIKNYQGTY